VVIGTRQRGAIVCDGVLLAPGGRAE